MKTQTKKFVGCLLVVVALLPAGDALRAADINWTNTAGGYWDVSSNWSAGVPGAADNARLDFLGGAYTVTATNAVTVGTVYVAGASGANPALVINMPDNLTVFSSAGLALAAAPGSRGTVTLQRGRLGAGGSFIFGNGGAGSVAFLNIFGGEFQITNNTRFGFGSTGIFLMSQGNYTATNAGTFANIGDSSYSLVTISGGVFQAQQGFIGANPGGVGEVRIFGGTNSYLNSLTFGGSAGATGSVLVAGSGVLRGALGMTIGGSGRGVMTVSNGAMVLNTGNHVLLGGGAGGSGELDLNGGNVLNTNVNMVIGAAVNGTGSVVMTSGSLSELGNYLKVGASGGGGSAGAGTLGTLMVGGGLLTVGNELDVGGATGAQGVMSITGGVVIVSNSVVMGVGGSVLVSGGGVLEASTLSASGGGVITNSGGIFQFRGGPSITTNGPSSIVLTNGVVSYRNVSSAVNIYNGNFGNVTFQGQNTFRLDNSSNLFQNYTFDTTNGVSQYQNLQLINGQASYFGNLTIGSGGSLLVSNATSASVANALTSQGAIKVIGSRVTYGGPVVIGGSYVSDPSTNIFTSNVTVTASGSLSGSNGDLFVFYQDLANQSTNRSQFNLVNATMLFTNGNGAAATNHTFNLTGSSAAEMGSNVPSIAPMSTNFGIGTLSLAASNRLTLTGDHLTNALYVGWLDLSAWNTNAGVSLTNTLQAALNLSSINLYYDNGLAGNAYLQGDTFNLWGGQGLLIPIPEPSALMLTLVAGALSSVFILKRKSGLR